MSILLIVSTPCLAADAGTDVPLRVEVLDAGTVLTETLTCMPPPDALRLRDGLRTAETERDALRVEVTKDGSSSVAVLVGIAALVVGLAGGVALGYAAHR